MTFSPQSSSSSSSQFFFFLFLCGSVLPISFSQKWNVKSFSQNLDNYHVFPQVGSKEKDLITTLPGQPAGVNFKQYSGYISVDSTRARNLFYYFVEAANGQASSKPLVLWLSSEIGESAIGVGAFEQHGPFRVKHGSSTLELNPYAWNQAANMLYLESPIGTSFSYSTNSSDICTGDEMAALDNYRFILNWLQRFPEYKTRDLFLAGEEYAGNYVPQLADVISYYNKHHQVTINLKGIILGNAALDVIEDARGKFEYLSTHALISDEASQEVRKQCSSPRIDKCRQALVNALPFVPTYNLEDIYGRPCNGAQALFSPGSIYNDAQSMYDCGQDDTVMNYLSLPEVHSAMHVQEDAMNSPWMTVSMSVWHSYERAKYNSSIPILKNLMAAGIHIWIYSGDFDAQNPVLSTQFSLRRLNLNVEKQWLGWYQSDTELAGMTLTYQGNLTFLTIRSAGHYIHLKQPARALTMFESIMEGKDLPRSSYFPY